MRYVRSPRQRSHPQSLPGPEGSSHTKNETEILSEAPLDEELIRKTVAETGYTLKGITSEPCEKKGFKLFG